MSLKTVLPTNQVLPHAPSRTVPPSDARAPGSGRSPHDHHPRVIKREIHSGALLGQLEIV